jgi:ParB family chromosome partitioning protein
MSTALAADEQRAEPVGGLEAAVRGLDSSPRLAQRRFAWLPVTGAGAPHTGLQGRGPSESTSLNGLGELLSSIAVHGVLSPILVEELTDADTGEIHLRLVTGEGRLRCCRIGLREDPDNTYFQRVPAMICPGPLTEEERNAWQLIENLARQDYQPGELASALLLERCAVLATRLSEAGAPVPEADLADTDDPVARWTLLDKTRLRHAPQIGAPWELVLRRLGVSFGPRKARQLVAAFQHLPRELSTDLDAHQIALTTRTGLVRLARDPRQNVAELWTAVKALGRPELLAAATAAAEASAAAIGARAALPPVEQAVDAAVALHDAANAARSEKLSRTDLAPTPHPDDDASDTIVAGGPQDNDDPAGADDREHAGIDPHLVTDVLDRLRELNGELRAGRRPPRYAVGSLQLRLAETTDLLATPAPSQPTTIKEAG